MEKRFDLAVFIGRFQPFHDGHLHVVLNALEHADRLLFIVGSSNLARSSRNPFTYVERATVIDEVMQGYSNRIAIRPANDFPYDLQKWIEQIQNIVAEHSDQASRIALTGHHRDLSSFYLRKFPQWGFITAPEENSSVNATTYRAQFFNQRYSWNWNEWVASSPKIPDHALRFLANFRQTHIFKELQNEFEAERNYRCQWGSGPFQTADAVVMQSGHVLVVERGGSQGTGKLALPGGNLNKDEMIADCAVRELFEETCLFEDIADMEERSQKVWAGYRGRERFDDPYRSPRARVITEAFLFKLPDAHALPPVKAADDAAKAFWLPLSQIKPDRMFDDHGFIVDRMMRYL